MKDKRVFNEDGTEFDYFDEYPSEDPWLICPRCEGSGEKTFHSRAIGELTLPCKFCDGKGKTK